MNFIFKSIVFVICAPFAVSVDPIRCPLKWVLHFTDSPIPEKSVPTQHQTHFIIKGTLEDGKVDIGRVHSESGLSSVGYLPSFNSTEKLGEYFILTNQYGCTIAWVDSKDPRVEDQGTIVENKLVGRVNTVNQLLPASVDRNSEKATFIDSTGVRGELPSYFVLISYSDGLKLELSNFLFHSSPPTSEDVFGIDEVTNLADVDVIYSVTHTKIITDTISMTEGNTKTSTWNVAASLDVSIGAGGIGGSAGIGMDFSKSSTNGFGNEITNSNTRTISVTRQIFVPPKTSIYACSTSSTISNSEMNYTCLAKYRAIGLNSSEVLNIVQKNFPTAEILGDSVVFETNGTLTGTLTMRTTFMTSPKDAVNGCNRIL